MHHTLKIENKFADVIVAGNKTFEVRKNDRDFREGDTIRFLPNNRPCTHEIFGRKFLITYVLSGWGIQPDYVVFGIKEVRNEV